VKVFLLLVINLGNLLFGVMTHSMKKKTEKIISKGLVFFCGILLVFSLACGKTATTTAPLAVGQSDQQETAEELLEKTRALQWKGEYDEAYDSYSNAIRMSPQDASLYFERGNISFLRLASLTGGSSLSPDDISLLVRRYCGLALYDFNEAISLDPHIDIFYYMRGSLLLFDVSFCHNAVAAIENFDKAIQLNPSNAVYYMERGKARISLGRYGQAADDLRKAAAIKGHDYQFYHDIGKLYEKIGMKREALSFYKQAMEQAPHDRLETLNRSLVLLRGGNNTDLIRDYTELIAKRPEAAPLYAMRGHRYSEREQFQEAVRDYSVVVGLQPDNKEIYMDRGLLFDRLNKKRESRQDFQMACKLGHAKACTTVGMRLAQVTTTDTKNVTSRSADIPQNTADTKRDALKSANIPGDTATDTKRETLENPGTPVDTIIKIEIAETEALKDAKPVRAAINTGKNDMDHQRSDPMGEWIPFWHSASDHVLYFYNMIKKAENNNIVRVRMEQDDHVQEARKGLLQEQKINPSKPYVLEFWSFDCHLANVSMMGRYSSAPQIVVSRSPYTNARQGMLSTSPAEMIDELWKTVCGERERATVNHTP